MTADLTTTAPTQADLILDTLRASGGWVGMPRLARASGSWNVHSRIAQLRTERGLTIENKVERRPGSRTNLSFYRLV